MRTKFNTEMHYGVGHEEADPASLKRVGSYCNLKDLLTKEKVTYVPEDNESMLHPNYTERTFVPKDPETALPHNFPARLTVYSAQLSKSSIQATKPNPLVALKEQAKEKSSPFTFFFKNIHGLLRNESRLVTEKPLVLKA